MKHIFLSFIGFHDLEGLGLKEKKFPETKNKGPLLFMLTELLKTEEIDSSIIINDFANVESNKIQTELENIFPKLTFKIINARKSVSGYNPARYDKIHELLQKEIKYEKAKGISWHVSLTSGTPTIISTLLLFGKTHLNANYYQTYYNKQLGKEVLEESYIPFDINLIELNRFIEDKVSSSPISEAIIGKSPQLLKAIEKAHRVAIFDVSCFIFGETGTGKELIAKEIHNSGKRANENFYAFNCSYFSDELARAELFGYKKDAFTGASKDKKGILKQNDGGILFLDEIGDLSLNVQTQLLRFLQEKTFIPVGAEKEEKADVKIIAATHKDIYNMIKEGKFREDLFYRLAIEIITLPPLRERIEDIPDLTDFLLKKINEEFGGIESENFKYIDKKIDSTAIETLKKHDWKGKIRELEHTLKRAAMWSKTDYISADEISNFIYDIPSKEKKTELPTFPINLKEYISELEKEIIDKALKKTSFKQNKAAELLNMDTTTLNKKLKKYKLLGGK